MRLVGRQLLLTLMAHHADVREPIKSWMAEVESANWQTPTDIKAKYATASFLSGNEVIFNLKGNKYRLKVVVAFAAQTVVVQKAGTHEEYNRWMQ